MASIHRIGQRHSGGQVDVVRGVDITSIGGQIFYTDDLTPSVQKFNEFWELMDVIKRHGYIRASMSVIGRSAVGTDWSIVKKENYVGNTPLLHKRRLLEFYTGAYAKDWNNIRDYRDISFNLMIGTQYLRYFGQVAYHIIRDRGTKRALGMYHLPGLIVPNVDSNGYFRAGQPAFIQYPSSNPRDRVEFKSPLDIIFITTPSWDGNPMGGSDIEALTEFTIPLDLYLQTGAREYLKNRDKPEVIYQVASDLNDDAFDTFRRQMEAVQRGSANLGKNPIIMQGDLKVHEMRDLPASLPYHEGRDDAMEEEMAVTGVGSVKLGVTKGLSHSNMREYRREFHETTMLPMFKILEGGFYEQVNVREFGIRGWEFQFDHPDFLTAVEQATVDMRYYAMGVTSPNEIRRNRGDDPRSDRLGDLYADELQIYMEEIRDERDGLKPTGGEQGSPPEGRDEEPDSPSNVGAPSESDQDPPRGDQHDDAQRIISELNSWKKFLMKRKGKPNRRFHTEIIPEDVADLIESQISASSTSEGIKYIFDNAVSAVGEFYG